MTRRRSLVRLLSTFVVLGAVALFATACQQDQRTLVPNRVLDRPLDVALACVERSSAGGIVIRSFNECNDSSPARCTADDAPQLIGFVANSERNEVAMFRRCDTDQAVVDVDADAPGHQLIPVGTLPSRIARTDDSCRVVTANVGSCDFSVLDTAGLASVALGVDTDRAASGLVSSVVPRRSDGTPLGAAPADVVPVPDELSLAPNAGSGSVDVDEGGVFDEGTGGQYGEEPEGDDLQSPEEPFAQTGTGGLDDDDDDDGITGDGGAETIPTVCSEQTSGSVYATFPACQLVAEIDLATGRILASRRLATELVDGQRVILVEDTGVDPSCPVECPGQFDGAIPDEAEPFDPDGMFPGTLALVLPPDVRQLEEGQVVDSADDLVTYSTLFVGGTGSDRIVELELDPNGGWIDPADVAQLELEDAQGIVNIRVTPPGLSMGEEHQFLYAIAGDGSTRVVDRFFNEGGVGVECDTQIDPTQAPASACDPIDPNVVDAGDRRRAFVEGPGLRAEGGATITDWAFFKIDGVVGEESDATEGISSPFSPGPDTLARSNLIGVGTTSFGLVTYVSFGQFQDATVETVDPIGLMNTEIRPHTLWPRIDPATGTPEALPLMIDDEPARTFGGDPFDSRVLSPTVRRIDRAYAVPSDPELSISAEQEAIAKALYTPGPLDEPGQDTVQNRDALGGFGEEGLYTNAPPRVVVRDYVQWRQQTMTLEWEGAVPGTGSTTGLIECDEHGGVDDSGDAFIGGTCRSSMAGDARLFDESANLCDDGVLAGDKLVLRGCTDDDSCGLGQRCLRAAAGPASATGICVSEQDYEANLDELRQVCAPFISDPCGTPLREYRIVRAFQNELWIQAMDVPERAVVREINGQLVEWEAKLSCAAPVPHRDDQPCRTEDECQRDPYAPDDPATDYTCDIPDGAETGRCRPVADTECILDEDCEELGLAYLCVEGLCQAPCNLCAPDAGQPEGGCTVDDDCLGDDDVCFAGTCHQACTDDSPGCIQSPLPGPRCFPEFVNYGVRLKDAFKVEGTSSPFFTEAVSADPDTLECIEDPTASNLLTSRLRLGRDEAETFGHPVWGIPDCPDALEASQTDPNPCRITGSRGDPGNALFHWFSYDSAPVEAIRFTNPYMSLVIDLTSLLDLAQPDPDTDLPWPAGMVPFRRARIPRGYRQEFGTVDGYTPFDEPVALGNNRLVYPLRLGLAPEPAVVFVVDAGSRGGLTPRGQVMRLRLGTQVLPDELFRVQ